MPSAANCALTRSASGVSNITPIDWMPSPFDSRNSPNGPPGPSGSMSSKFRSPTIACAQRTSKSTGLPRQVVSRMAPPAPGSKTLHGPQPNAS